MNIRWACLAAVVVRVVVLVASCGKGREKTVFGEVYSEEEAV